MYLYKSYPAAWGEPREGVVAFAVSFCTLRERIESQASRVFLGWKARSGDPGEEMAIDICRSLLARLRAKAKGRFDQSETMPSLYIQYTAMHA